MDTQIQIDNRKLEKKLQALSLGEPVCLSPAEKQQIANLEEALLDDESCVVSSDKNQSKVLRQNP